MIYDLDLKASTAKKTNVSRRQTITNGGKLMFIAKN